eukprot:6204003-Pleurochrysis_carterae.AAC.7
MSVVRYNHTIRSQQNGTNSGASHMVLGGLPSCENLTRPQDVSCHMLLTFRSPHDVKSTDLLR